MRCFIAIDVEDFFTEVFDELRKIYGLKLVSPENLHVTLKFLGEIEESKVDKIHESMQQALKDFKSFEIDFRGVGTFPSLKYIRVVWIGIDKNKERIVEIQKAIDEKLFKNLNFKKESRFDPHLTIARVKIPKEKQKIIKTVSRFKNKKFGAFRVEKVILKKSKLTPHGPIYTKVREVCLQ